MKKKNTHRVYSTGQFVNFTMKYSFGTTCQNGLWAIKNNIKSTFFGVDNI